MKRLWQRFLRLCRESEIRLSASELRLDVIRTGDLLQVGPRLFRVTGRLAGSAGLELTAASEGRARPARLARAESDPLRPWVLEERDARTFLASCDLLHFPRTVSSRPTRSKPSAIVPRRRLRAGTGEVRGRAAARRGEQD